MHGSQSKIQISKGLKGESTWPTTHSLYELITREKTAVGSPRLLSVSSTTVVWSSVDFDKSKKSQKPFVMVRLLVRAAKRNERMMIPRFCATRYTRMHESHLPRLDDWLMGVCLDLIYLPLLPFFNASPSQLELIMYSETTKSNLM